MTDQPVRAAKPRKVKSLLVREMQGLEGDDLAIETVLRRMSDFGPFDNVAFEVSPAGKLLWHFRVDEDMDGQSTTMVSEINLGAHLKERIEARLIQQGFNVLQDVDDVPSYPEPRRSAPVPNVNAGTPIDTVLIWEQSPGVAATRFCTAAEANAALDVAQACSSSARLITVDDKMGAETYYQVSAEFREKVDAARRDVQLSLEARDAMDRHGVPHDRDLRIAVYRAIVDMRSLAVFETLNPSASRSEWKPRLWPSAPSSGAARRT